MARELKAQIVCHRILGRNYYKQSRLRGQGYRILYTSCSIRLLKGPVQRAAKMQDSTYRCILRHLCCCVSAVGKESNFSFDYCEWACESSIIQLIHPRSVVLSLSYELAGVHKERILYRGQESRLGLCPRRVCRGCERRMVGHRGREFEGVGEGMSGGLMTQRELPPLDAITELELEQRG